jgi:hypothetical protein
MGYPQGPGSPPPPPTQPYGYQQTAQAYSAQPYYQPSSAPPPAYHQGGSPAKIILIVIVVLAVVGGGALLVTQVSKKSAASPTTSTLGVGQTVTPSPENRTTSSIATSSSSASTTTRATTTTTRSTTTTRPSTGGGIDIGSGVSIVPAPGWSVRVQQSDLVVLVKTGAVFQAETQSGAGSSSADAVVGQVLQVLSRNLTNFQTGGSIMSLTPPKSNILSAAGVQFGGTLAGQQGSTDIEGGLVALVRDDGVAVFFYSINGVNQTSSFSSDYTSMAGSVVSSL